MNSERAKYIDWCQYMADPCGADPPSIDTYDPAKYLYWRDCITETLFYIPRQRLKEINAKALAYMKEDLDDDINRISHYLCNCEMECSASDPDIMLFPHLPYCLPSKKDCNENTVLPRISDIVAIRTALLYALYGNKALSNADKERLRRYGLLRDIGLYIGQAYSNDLRWPELDKICRQVDDFLQGLPIEEDSLPTFNVVKGSSVKIKQYYLS